MLSRIDITLYAVKLMLCAVAQREREREGERGREIMREPNS
jgi:hypothetical protein